MNPLALACVIASIGAPPLVGTPSWTPDVLPESATGPPEAGQTLTDGIQRPDLQAMRESLSEPLNAIIAGPESLKSLEYIKGRVVIYGGPFNNRTLAYTPALPDVTFDQDLIEDLRNRLQLRSSPDSLNGPTLAPDDDASDDH